MNAKKQFIRDCKLNCARCPPSKASQYVVKGMNWFLTCCKYGSLETLQHLHAIFEDEGVNHITKDQASGLKLAMMNNHMKIIEYIFDEDMLSIDFLTYDIQDLKLLDTPCNIATFRQIIKKLNNLYDSSFIIVEACLSRQQYDLFDFQEFDLQSKLIICNQSLKYSSDNTLLSQLLHSHCVEQLTSLQDEDKILLMNLLIKVQESDESIKVLSSLIIDQSKDVHTDQFITCLSNNNIKSAILYQEYVNVSQIPWLLIVCRNQINVSDLYLLITSIWKKDQEVKSSTDDYSWISCQNKDIIEYLLKHDIYQQLKVVFHHEIIKCWNETTSEILRLVLKHNKNYVPSIEVMRKLFDLSEYDLIDSLASKIQNKRSRSELINYSLKDHNILQILIQHNYDVKAIRLQNIIMINMIEEDYPTELMDTLISYGVIKTHHIMSDVILSGNYELIEHMCSKLDSIHSEHLYDLLKTNDVKIYQIIKSNFPNINAMIVYNHRMIDHALKEASEWHSFYDVLMTDTYPTSGKFLKCKSESFKNDVIYQKLLHVNVIESKLDIHTLISLKNKNYVFRTLCANGHLSAIKKIIQQSKKRK